jgi:hypothetical protein
MFTKRNWIRQIANQQITIKDWVLKLPQYPKVRKFEDFRFAELICRPPPPSPPFYDCKLLFKTNTYKNRCSADVCSYYKISESFYCMKLDSVAGLYQAEKCQHFQISIFLSERIFLQKYGLSKKR